MVDDRNGRVHPSEPIEDVNGVEQTRGSGMIFVLVAIALILAISFFYLTKDRDDEQSRVMTEVVQTSGSAADVVGDAAQQMADRLRDRN
jgi:uncharacterized protein HemX